MNREQARDLAIELKTRGATYLEIKAELQKRGSRGPRGRPFGRIKIAQWCREASGEGALIGDQRGRRHPHLVGMTPAERRAHDLEMYERKLERGRRWRAKNPEKLREYKELYKSLKWC